MPTNGSVIADNLQSVRLGVVAVFGIVAPGIWFWSTSVFYIAYLFGFQNLDELASRVQTMKLLFGPYLVWTISFLVVYVSGSVLRILPPDVPDYISLWRVQIREKGEIRITIGDRFPYKSLPGYLKDRGLNAIASLVPWESNEKQNNLPSLGKRSKTFVHFVKLYIALHKPQLASYLAQQEAFIRLLSGIFYASFLSTLLIAIGYSIQRTTHTQIAKLSFGVLIFNILIASGILHAFHYQRLRELMMILSAYFLIGPPDKSPYSCPAEQQPPLP